MLFQTTRGKGLDRHVSIALASRHGPKAFNPGGQMNVPHTRREFLADVGRVMLVVTVGYGLASELGLAPAFAAGAADAADTLDFGPLEPLVRFMQETPANKLLPALADKLKAGADLPRLVAAPALANARTSAAQAYLAFPPLLPR